MSDGEWSGSDVEEICSVFSEGEAVSIFEDFSSDSLEEVWDHMRENHGVDYHEIRRVIPGFSDYQRIVLVNALRKAFKEGGDALEVMKMQVVDPGSAIWADQDLLQPVREDDRLLFEAPYDNSDDSDMHDEHLESDFEGENAHQQAFASTSSARAKVELAPAVENWLQEVNSLGQLPESYYGDGRDRLERARQILIMMSDEEAIEHLKMLQRWSSDPDLMELKQNPENATMANDQVESSSSSDESDMPPVAHPNEMGKGKGCFTGPGSYRIDENGNILQKTPDALNAPTFSKGGKSKGASKGGDMFAQKVEVAVGDHQDNEFCGKSGRKGKC